MQGDDKKYIRDLIAEGEHQQQDFKFEITNSRKIARTLVAFANTDGGRLLIGVKDNGKISGIRTDEEYYMIEAAASLYSKPEIPFKSHRRTVEGKTILEITVLPSEHKPHYARSEDDRWLAYHRVKDQNFLADYILLQVWKRQKRSRGTFIAYSENEQRVLETLNTGKVLDFNEIRQKTRFRKNTLQQILINLVSLQAVKMNFLEEKICFSIEEQP
jgi:predicted HTH transcriptional regulator